jgi:hypothetical protein
MRAGTGLPSGSHHGPFGKSKKRGEAAALDRDDLDSEARELTITRQLIALPGELYCGPPKSRASVRTIALDEDGTRTLVDQAARQAVELLKHQFTEQRPLTPVPAPGQAGGGDGRCSPTPTGGSSALSTSPTGSS